MSNGTCIEQDDLTKILFGLFSETQKEEVEEQQEKRQRVIVIAGPTASGKTELALHIAKTLGGEIISGDSMQVYEGMDIGTAKASAAQRAAIPHHLLDVCHVAEPFNVVDFYYQASHCCQTILLQNKAPIVAGGSGFYLHTLLYGPPSGPPSLPDVRKALEEELVEVGIDTLYSRLKKLDPDYAKTITFHDKQKIIRALEIIGVTRQPVSALNWRERTQPCSYDFRCWFIHRPKDSLYRLINDRCDRMLNDGFLDEVDTLRKIGIKDNPSASQAIGYRQALSYLDSPQRPEDYEAFATAFKRASRRYAKQQFTWFRKEPLFRWLDVDLHDLETAADMIISDYTDEP